MEEGREQIAMRVEQAMRKPLGPVLTADCTVSEALARATDVHEDPLLVSYETGRWTSVRKSALADAVKNGKGELHP